MPLHVFVAMPFGEKEGIDFNRVYEDLIAEALQGDFEVFRADQEHRAGDIRTDMFQELLLADLVIADLSLDNPNVWYELGVRHALRARGVVQIQCLRDHMPFDVGPERSLRYRVRNGTPDPQHVNEDRAALLHMARETVAAWRGRRVSPVYRLLGYLEEPEWKALRVDGAREFWDRHEAWEGRVERARRKGRPGDILVLAEEPPVQVLRLEAYRRAARALRDLGCHDFALEQAERALAIDEGDRAARQEKGVLLGRLGHHGEARDWLHRLVGEHPGDAESWALLGRTEKDAWVKRWNREGLTSGEKPAAAAEEEAVLLEAIRAYAAGFQVDPSHYYSGINSATLLYLWRHLTGDRSRDAELQETEGGVRWAIRCALAKETPVERDFWARATLADLEVLSRDEASVGKAYRHAAAAADGNWFQLDSVRQQILLLRNLSFRPPQVAAALRVLDGELDRLVRPELRWEPTQVFLFSGHMIDAPGRPEPRFPPAREPAAARAIRAALDEMGAGEGDLALCGGACGGDLLFAEACLERGLLLELRIPFDEPTFLQKSVLFAGESWRDRFYAVKEHPNTTLYLMPDELGPTPAGASPYERDNLWQLYSALARGPRKVRFLCLWNRKGGDGPGGTQHMHDAVLKRSGRVYVLDTNQLW